MNPIRKLLSRFRPGGDVKTDRTLTNFDRAVLKSIDDGEWERTYFWRLVHKSSNAWVSVWPDEISYSLSITLSDAGKAAVFRKLRAIAKAECEAERASNAAKTRAVFLGQKEAA